MKTQKFYTGLGLMLIVLGIISFINVSCSSKAGQGETSGTELKVSPPAMDLHSAVVIGDLDIVRQHIAAGSDLDVREESVGSTPLISASVFDQREIAAALIGAGADVNIQNREGSTALHTAAFLCRVEIVEMLLENGADKSLKNIYGSTPHMSVAGPFAEVKPIYDEFRKALGGLGLRLDDDYLSETRPRIATLLK